jgi:hypothetical protein
VNPYGCILAQAFVIWRMRCEERPHLVEHLAIRDPGLIEGVLRKGLLTQWPWLERLGANFLQAYFYSIFYCTLNTLTSFVEETFGKELNHPVEAV